MNDCIEHDKKTTTRMGYGLARYQGKTTTLHRVVLMKATGLNHDTAKGLQARHKCDNPRCINPAHLEWGTHSDNMDDRQQRGRTKRHAEHGRAVLSLDSVRAIRASGDSLRVLAARYGVSKDTIGKIKNLKTWVDINGEPL